MMMKRNLKMMMAAAMMAAVVAVSAGCSGSQGSGAQEESAQSGGTQESSTQGSVAQEGDGQLKAVSYTHLDVYKRQAHGRPFGGCICLVQNQLTCPLQ